MAANFNALIKVIGQAVDAVNACPMCGGTGKMTRLRYISLGVSEQVIPVGAERECILCCGLGMLFPNGNIIPGIAAFGADVTEE